MANPGLGLLNSEKTQRGSLATPSPLTLLLRGANKIMVKIIIIITHKAYNEEKKRVDGMKGHPVAHLHACLGATQVSVHFAPVQDYFDSPLGELVLLCRSYASVYDHNFLSLVAFSSLGEV